MLVAAAFVPIPPLLVPEIAGGTAASDEGIRTACGNAIRRLLASAPDELLVIGPGTEEGPVEGSWDWRGFGVPVPDPAPDHRLPHGLAIGGWLLDTYAGTVQARRYYAVTADLSAQSCAELGRRLVGGHTRIGLLVCGDGSAARTEKAPGHLDAAAEPWDDAALTALREADPDRLLDLDAAIGRRVLAAGRAPWQVMAGAAEGGRFEPTIDGADAPYGVLYVAGTWIRKDGATR
jgi:hypothetical protein